MRIDVSGDKLVVICSNAGHTRALGSALGAAAEIDQCIAMDGDLGVGKTELVRGLALGAGVIDASLISSPTYVLLNVYPADNPAGAKTIFHLDAYRIVDESGFDAVGWNDLFGQKAIIAVEWAHHVRPLLPHDTLFIAGEWLADDDRCWTLSARGTRSESLLHAVQLALASHSRP
jgi:tRNA threonylcarbamoyladenosine biosynthesis protein TsaE